MSDENQPALLSLAPMDENPPQPPTDENPPQGDTSQVDEDQLTLDALLEKAGIDAEQFYGLELPTEAGKEPVTLGAAKDAAKDLQSVVERQAQAELEITERENSVLTKLREAQTLHNLLPAEAKSAEVTNELKRLQDAHLENERVLMLDALPHWSDKDTRLAEQKGIVDLLGSYGFGSQEISLLSDHRMVKLMRDFSHIKATIKGAEDKQKRGGRKPPGSKQKPQSKTERIKSDLAAGKITQEQHDGLILLAGLDSKG